MSTQPTVTETLTRLQHLRVRSPAPEALESVAPEGPVRFPLRALAAVGGAAAVAGAVATAYVFRLGYTTLYLDARSHLNIARRVFDNINPGLAQFGSVWLPMQHMLMLPFVAIRPLWVTGLAGSIVGLGALVYTSINVFRIVFIWTNRREASWLAVAIVVFNPNLLYLQSTALTEPLFVALFSGACYHIAVWAQGNGARQLIWASVLTAGAAMTRYDGWFVAVIGILAVAVAETVRRKDWVAGQASALTFGAASIYLILLWFLYNLVIFDDPFFFQSGPYSAEAQQTRIFSSGRLPTKHQLGVSLFTYAADVVYNCGILVTIAGVIGCVFLIARKKLRFPGAALAIMLWSPFVFNVISLERGQSVISLPVTDPPGFFNVRYGVMLIPALAVGAALLVNAVRGKRLRMVVGSTLVVAQVAAFVAAGTPIVVKDGLSGSSSALALSFPGPARYLRQNFDGGRILLDDYTGSPLLFETRLDFRNFVTTGNHPFWERALANPASEVRWIVVGPDDAVDLAINPSGTGATGKEPKLDPYDLVFRNDLWQIYRKKAGEP